MRICLLFMPLLFLIGCGGDHFDTVIDRVGVAGGTPDAGMIDHDLNRIFGSEFKLEQIDRNMTYPDWKSFIESEKGSLYDYRIPMYSYRIIDGKVAFRVHANDEDKLK